MKFKKLTLTVVLILSMMTAFMAGCAPKQQAPTPAPKQTTPSETTPDVKTTASIVNTEAAFLNAISSKGTWIIAITQDLTTSKDLVVEGEFKNGKKDADGKDIIQRKLALYAQDENRKVTARYNLTAPKMTILSPKTGLWYGTFKGDIYVSAKEFQLIGAKVDGNIYFTTDEAQSTFKKDADSSVTGKTELKK